MPNTTRPERAGYINKNTPDALAETRFDPRQASSALPTVESPVSTDDVQEDASNALAAHIDRMQHRERKEYAGPMPDVLSLEDHVTYDVKKVLGEGGSGIVFLATQHSVDIDTGKVTSKDVVIKTFSPNKMDTAQNLKQGQHLDETFPTFQEFPSNPSDTFVVKKLVDMSVLWKEFHHLQRAESTMDTTHVIKTVGGMVELQFPGRDDIRPIGIVMEYAERGNLRSEQAPWEEVVHEFYTEKKKQFFDEQEHIVADASLERQHAFNALLEARDQLIFLGDEEIIAMAIQIAEGIAAIHASSMVHRDIKPENILIRGDGNLAIGDLGITELVSQVNDLVLPPTKKGVTRPGTSSSMDQKRSVQLQSSNNITGTPIYLSPEGLRGEKPGASFDLYALGTIMYELKVGEAPFYKEYIENDLFQAMDHHKVNKPPSIRSHGVRYMSTPLDAMIESMIQNDKGKRAKYFYDEKPVDIATASECVQALKQLKEAYEKNRGDLTFEKAKEAYFQAEQEYQTLLQN